MLMKQLKCLLYDFNYIIKRKVLLDVVVIFIYFVLFRKLSLRQTFGRISSTIVGGGFKRLFLEIPELSDPGI